MGKAGPLQGQGVQQVAGVSGLEPVETLVADGLRVTLRSKDGRMPFLNGYNHLVWRDGEPIDPFVLAVLGPDGTAVWQREIFNDGKRLMEMSPLQRLYSSRGPCGLDTNLRNIPPWALASLGEQEREQLANPGFPISYLKQRAGVLAGALTASLDAPEWSRDAVDRVVSFAERLRLVAAPSGFTVGWLRILLNYGHTVSGEQVAADPALPAGLTTATGLKLQLAPSGAEHAERTLVRRLHAGLHGHRRPLGDGLWRALRAARGHLRRRAALLQAELALPGRHRLGRPRLCSPVRHAFLGRLSMSTATRARSPSRTERRSPRR